MLLQNCKDIKKNHSQLKSMPRGYFLVEKKDHQVLLSASFASALRGNPNAFALQASFAISEKMSLTERPSTSGEELMVPPSIQAAKIGLDGSGAKALKESFSVDSVRRRCDALQCVIHQEATALFTRAQV